MTEKERPRILKIYHHNATDPILYQDALKIRTAVFVEEQGIPLSLEIDDNELWAMHFVAYDENNQPIGTARVLPDGHIQRVAVLAAYRHQGVGKALLEAIITFATAQDLPPLTLGAQVSAIGFYQALGFTLTDKPEFLDAGIAHREMSYRPA